MNTLRVIVADDHDLVRSTVISLIRSLGVDVVGEATNGREAIDSARRLQPDLVVMDGNMPVTNGYEATRTIKATMPGVRVAIVSVSAGPVYEQQAALVAADAFITKSSLKQSLCALVQDLIQKRKIPVVGAAA